MAAKKLLDYRENPNRSIYISEKVDSDLLHKLTPTINKMRLESSAPITLYLDSPGGYTGIAQLIQRLLKAPDQDGESRRIITVATNDVASAAADLLLGGDYSMAYEHASIHYHGSRLSSASVTNEEAEALAQSLSVTNSFYAQKLVEISIYNFAFLGTIFRAEIDAEKIPTNHTGVFAYAYKLASLIRSKLSSENQSIIDDLCEEIREYERLTVFLEEKLKDMAEGPARDLSTIKHIADYKFNQLDVSSGKCMVDENFIARVQKSYLVFMNHNKKFLGNNFGRIFRTVGPTMLGTAKIQEYDKLDKGQRAAFLAEHALERFYPMYLFATALAFRLQRGENRLTALDAYWLGLINEVVGSSLPCLRDVFEAAADTEPELPLDKTAK